MKKICLCASALLMFIPAQAQYLLEKSNNKQTKKEISESYQFSDTADTIQRGCRGFAEIGMGISTTASDSDDNLNLIMLNASYGYQVLDNYLFVGAGVGYWNMYSYGGSALPLFAQIRSDFYSFGKVSVYADMKIGYSIIDHAGLFVDPQIGIRYGLKNKLGLNFGIGFQSFNDNGFSYEGGTGIGYFTIKAGIDF